MKGIRIGRHTDTGQTAAIVFATARFDKAPIALTEEPDEPDPATNAVAKVA